MEVKKVLVVDDEVNLANFIKDFLEEEGFEVILAHSGQEALDKAAQIQPDIILLDIMLPDIDGYTVCQRLREDVKLRHVPIVMLSAKSDDGAEITGLKAGADDYLSKPFKGAKLLTRIWAAIQRNIRELDANPLTRLPGNVAIVNEIKKRIDSGAQYAVLYMDLNNFKAFNDYYGFVRGDQAIKVTAEVILDVLKENGAPDDFIGHIGGDDFVVTADYDGATAFCQKLLSRFDARIAELYDEADRGRGYIITTDRQGRQITIPIMGLAIAVVTNQYRQFKHPGEISAVAGELKKLAKSAGNSAFVIDRRTH